MKKFRSCLYWEFRIRFEKVRYIILGLAAMDALLFVLPQRWCRKIDDYAMLLVTAVSILYVAAVMYMLLMPSVSMTASYDTPQRKLEQLSKAGTWRIMGARLTANLAVTAVFMLAIKGGEILMKKFADSSHSYFSFNQTIPIPGTILAVGVLFPVLYIWAFLILYRRNQNRHGVLAWIIAAILYDFIHFHDLSVGWELAVKTLLCIPFFLFAVRMERETEL